MSDTSRPVTIQILDKEYVVSCPQEDEDSLLTAAQLLNSQMQEIRDSGKIIGAERIAVMAALNIANELQQQKAGNSSYTYSVSTRIRALQDKVDTALGKYRQLELSN